MSDYREVQHGYSILLNYFNEKLKSESFKNVFDKITLGAADRALTHFDNWWKSGGIQFKTFIASFSEHKESENLHGRLSMWRAFGNTPAKVALVFNVPARSLAAQTIQFEFNPVNYFKKDEEEQLITEVIKMVEINIHFLRTLDAQKIEDWIFNMLLLAVTCTKHEGFLEESEWRLVYFPQLYPSSLMVPSNEVIAGVPQSIYKLPLDKGGDPLLGDLNFSTLFDRLIIGPSPYPRAMFDAYRDALTQAGVHEAENKIVISGIPIRS